MTCDRSKIRIFFNHSIWRILLLILADTLCVAGTTFLSFFLLDPACGEAFCQSGSAVFPFIAAILLCNTLFGCYNGSILYPGAGVNKIEEIRRLAGGVCIAYLLVFSWYAISLENPQRYFVIILTAAFLTGVLLPIARGLTRRLMKYLQIGQTRILIAGAGKAGAQIALAFGQDSYFGFQVVGFLDDDPAKQGCIISGVPVLGPLDAAQQVARQHDVNYLVCCIPIPVLTRLYRELSLYFKHIMFIPAIQIFPIAWVTPVSIGIFSGFEIQNKLLQPLSRILKLVIEVILSAVVMLALLPLFLILIPLIKFTSPGPVFYRAPRLGQNGKEIQVWKFRTMYQDAESRLEELLSADPALKEEWERDFKLQNDPRITPVGNFLRKTSLDELPQFWNVLTGTMSIIGPRPIVQDEVRYFGKYYDLRKRVKPGITGLWQVSGRNDTGYQLRVMLDTYYIMNWSIWIDYYIFFKTVYIVLMRKGAR